MVVLWRGRQVIFTEIIAVFRALLKISRHKQELAENTQVIRQLNSLWSLLARKVDTERKYINKLEGSSRSPDENTDRCCRGVVLSGQGFR